MTPWIQNISKADVTKGFHFDAGLNSMLIQIADPPGDFPVPKHQFKEVHQFDFLDMEKPEDFVGGEEFMITDDQADSLTQLLRHALDNHMNVVVHCVAGVCRSGAVCEVGVMMGFRDVSRFRSPNLLVKHKMMRALGWMYDDQERPYTIQDGQLVCHIDVDAAGNVVVSSMDPK